MIQSLVADAVSRALDHLYKCREIYSVDYRIVLQIHDAVVLEVPIKYADIVYDVVLPKCMEEMVEIWPTFLGGERQTHVTKPYHLSINRDVYLHWGDDIPPEASDIFGVPERFCNPDTKSTSVRDLIRMPGWLDLADKEKLQSFLTMAT